LYTFIFTTTTNDDFNEITGSEFWLIIVLGIGRRYNADKKSGKTIGVSTAATTTVHGGICVTPATCLRGDGLFCETQSFVALAPCSIFALFALL